MKILKLLIILILITKPSYALELKGDFKQGSLIIGKTNPKFQVYVQSKKLKINREGFFIFGVSRDQTQDIIIEIRNNSSIQKVIKKVIIITNANLISELIDSIH